jgi:hypothetical protein
MAWSAELDLKGAGGEPVDLWRTLASHGVADLPPQVLDEDARTLETTLTLPRESARTIRVRAGRPGFALVEAAGRVGTADATLLAETAHHILRLDEDLSGFYATAREDPDLSWAATAQVRRSQASARGRPPSSVQSGWASVPSLPSGARPPSRKTWRQVAWCEH